MKTKIWLRTGVGALLTGIALSGSTVHAIPYSLSSPDEVSKFHSPEDIFNSIPFLGSVPRSFIFGDGFKMKMTSSELRIDHMAAHSHSPADQRQCMIGLSYAAPVAGFFTTRMDIPLLTSNSPALSNWAMSSLGDYVVRFSRTPVDGSTIRLVASARF